MDKTFNAPFLKFVLAILIGTRWGAAGGDNRRDN